MNAFHFYKAQKYRLLVICCKLLEISAATRLNFQQQEAQRCFGNLGGKYYALFGNSAAEQRCAVLWPISLKYFCLLAPSTLTLGLVACLPQASIQATTRKRASKQQNPTHP